MIRSEWQQTLRFASQAALSELLDPQATVTGTLAGDPGKILAEDRDALASIGLPRIKNCLYPAIEPMGSPHNAGKAFQLGSSDGDLSTFTEGIPSDRPQHFFIAESASGHVVHVSRISGEYHAFVNSSIRQFVETAWRYHHMKPVLFEMQYSGDDIPFAFEEEHTAVKEFVWATALQVDPAIGQHQTDGFWWSAIWEYL